MSKQVILDSFISWAGTDRSDQFTSFDVMSERSALDASVFGDKTEKIEVGTFKNSLKAKLRPDANWTFLSILMTEYAAGANVAVIYRASSAVKSTSNPELTFSVMLNKAPRVGGERNTLLETDLDVTINTKIVYDYSTTTVDLG